MKIDDYLRERVSEIERLILLYNDELKKLPEGTLWTENRYGRTIHYLVTGDKKKPQRRVITRNTELVKGLMRRRYLETEIVILDGNEKVFRDMLKCYNKGYVADTFENVIERMRAKGKNQDYTDYFSAAFFQLDPPIDKRRYSREIVEWAQAPYKKSDYLPENLRHRTSHGLLLRSKSEVTIAEKLYEYGIPFRYEEVIERNGIVIIPDFTIKTPDGRTIIWEHAGRMNNPEYANRHKKKMKIYEELGFYPWKNMIITYDDEFGSIDMRIIKSEIENKLL